MKRNTEKLYIAKWCALTKGSWVGVTCITSGWKHLGTRTWLLTFSFLLHVELAQSWNEVLWLCATVIPSNLHIHADIHWTHNIRKIPCVKPLRFLIFDGYPCPPGIKSIWSLWIIFSMCWQILFVNSLLMVSSLMSLSEIGLWFLSVCVCVCTCEVGNLSDFDIILST